MSESTGSSQSCIKSLLTFPLSYSQMKRIKKEIVAQGSEEAITFWIRHIVRSHFVAKDSLNELSPLKLLVLLDYCFYFQIRDSKVVVEVLDVIDSYVNMLDTVLGSAILQSDTVLAIKIDMPKKKGKQKFGYLPYLLHHAAQRKRTFNGQWFSDGYLQSDKGRPPVFFALNHGSKESLLTLLQYGFPVSTEKYRDVVHQVMELNEIPILRKFLREEYYEDLVQYKRRNSSLFQDVFTMFILLVQTYGDWFCMEDGSEYKIPEFWEKFRIIWRAVSYPFITVNKSHEAMQTVRDCWKFLRELHRTRFSCIHSGRLQPRSLEHLCRCTVREKLRRNWKLPSGIKDLDLPPSMCKYLNLEID